MKMVWMHCNETLADEMCELLDAACISYYSAWRSVLGKDNEGERTRWDDAVFPGKNWAFQFLCDEGALDEIKRRLEILFEDPYAKESGVRIYALEAEKIL